METPSNISNVDYTWYLNTERDIITYIITYISYCDALNLRYLQQFVYKNSYEFISQCYCAFQMLDEMIKLKLKRPGTNLDELYNYQEIDPLIRLVGRGHPTCQFHVQCIRDLIYFIDTNRGTVSEFDFDRHQSLYNIIHEQNMHIEREEALRKERWEREEKEREKEREQRTNTLDR